MSIDTIDQVIKNAIIMMQNSKYQIFEISEGARSERQALENEHSELMEETRLTIEQVEKLERDFKQSRIRLSEVSRDFKRFSEDDIKKAYEIATDYQLKLTVAREKEGYLRARRDDLQKRIKNAEKQLERAEVIVSQMNVVLQYLSGDLNQVTRILESAKNRQLFGLKIILAQEEERRRISREIHDGLAQSMANFVLRTEIAGRMLAKKEYDSVQEELYDLKGLVRSGLEEVRRMIFDLRPMALDDLGLVPTVRKFVQDFEEETKVRAEFELSGREKRLPSGMEVAIFRLIQEALTNAKKHAGATFVHVGITFSQKVLKITVKDNGIGFNTEMWDKTSGTSFGLLGMRERVELLEGDIEVISAFNQGTEVSILIPVNPKNKEE